MSDAKGTDDTVRPADAGAQTVPAHGPAQTDETLPAPVSTPASKGEALRAKLDALGAAGTVPAAIDPPKGAITLPGGVDETLPGGAATVPGANATLASTFGTDETRPAGLDAVPTHLPTADRATYELREQLGAGGMGKVVVARDKRLGRLLAIKVARVSDPGLRMRFTREAVLTARLQHPSIIPVHEAGVWPGEEPFYAMKLVAGAPLSKLIAKTTTLDERLALIPNVIAVVDALAYAHAQRVIHRDLKPDNVIVGEYGETIVIDWGLAKELDSEDDEPTGDTPYRATDAAQTVEGAAMGTPPYMAPEQAKGDRLDERADVYGLGAMLYHVLCGEQPYKGATAQEVMDQVEAGPPKPLGERALGIPKDLLAIVDKAMARDKAQRYANAKQLADDLKRFQRGQLVAAHAYSRGELVRRWLVRHKLPVAIAAIALVVIAVASTMWLKSELRERELRGRQITNLLRADEADHETTRAHLRDSHFDEAESTLEAEVKKLGAVDAADVAQLRAKRGEELVRVKQIAEFHRRVRAGLFLLGDEDRGDEAISELETALKQVGALDAQGHVQHPNWAALYPNELTDGQRREMQWQAYRLVMALASLHFKQGSLSIKMVAFLIAKSPEATAHFRGALEVLGLTDELERVIGVRPAETARVFQRMALYFLKSTGTEQDIAAVGDGPVKVLDADLTRAENPIDHWFLGVAHLLVWATRNDMVGKGLKAAFPDLFDYVHPLETAEQKLRLALRLDPSLYWPHFMLGLVQIERGDFTAAELQYDDCIQLEPTYTLAYGARALTLANRSLHEDGDAKQDTLMRIEEDSKFTIDHEPNHPVTWWARGDMQRVLSKRADAIESYNHAFEIDTRVLEKFSRQVKLQELPTYVEEDTLYATDVNALDLLGFCALGTKDYDEAQKRAGQALAIDPANKRAQTIRDTAKAKQAAAK